LKSELARGKRALAEWVAQGKKETEGEIESDGRNDSLKEGSWL